MAATSKQRTSPFTHWDDYERPFVLAIDIGSSSVKAALYDSRARRLPSTEARDSHPLHTTREGAAEEAPEHLLQRVDGVVDQALALAGEASREIVAVALDTMASTVLGVDRDGAPVTPIYTYADTRGKEVVDQLRHELDVRAVYQRTGTPQHTSYLPVRLRWLQQVHPKMLKRIHRWMDPGGFLYSRWFGKLDVPCSYSIASWTGLLDRHRLQWDEELLRLLCTPRESLPALAEYSEAQCGLAQSYAQRWPVLKDVPFFLAVGDGVSANVGSGCVAADKVALTMGTSGATRILVGGDIDYVPPGLWAYRQGKEYTLLGGAFSDGGSVFAWALDNLRLPSKDKLDSLLQSLPPDGHGLTVLPFLSGERSPGWSASASGTMHGVTLSTTALEMLQASLEALAYRFALVNRLMRPYIAEPHKIIASGGAITSSPYMLQLMADVLRHPVIELRDEEVTSRGTAILGLRALEIWPDLDTVPPQEGDLYEPDPERGKLYQRGLERQHALYDRLIGHEQEVAEKLRSIVKGTVENGEGLCLEPPPPVGEG